MPRPSICTDLLRHADAAHHSFARTADEKPRYRLGGVAAALALCGASDARKVFAHHDIATAATSGRNVVRADSGWASQLPFAWGQKISYPLFLRAFKGEPLPFSKAVHCIATFDAFVLNNGLGVDIYTVMDIIPCSYNIDGFNSEVYDSLRAMEADSSNGGPFVTGALRASRQSAPMLLDDMAKGYCVTKDTADRIHQFIVEFNANHSLQQCPVGVVRSYPGKKLLGQKRASDNEGVDTDVACPQKAYVGNKLHVGVA